MCLKLELEQGHSHQDESKKQEPETEILKGVLIRLFFFSLTKIKSQKFSKYIYH